MTLVNPFNKSDADRSLIWEMLVSRDTDAFVNQDWSMVAEDFIADGFIGIDARQNKDPNEWRLSFPDLETYKTEWLNQAHAFSDSDWEGDAKEMLLNITELSDIEINGDTALAHKKFSGYLVKASGEKIPASWQTLYNCRRLNGTWKISGFTGYIPHFSENSVKAEPARIQMPEHAKQHVTAGPYSPVLIVNPSSLVVISGQAAIAENGDVIGDTFEEQVAHTLENCKNQLAFAGCGMEDVFKVNVYMKDLADWPKFNNIYKNYFGKVLPVRTAVQTGLLANLLVEIELWAAKG